MLLVSVGTYVDCFLTNEKCHASEYFSKQITDWTVETFNKTSPLYNFVSESNDYVAYDGLMNLILLS